MRGAHKIYSLCCSDAFSFLFQVVGHKNIFTGMDTIERMVKTKILSYSSFVSLLIFPDHSVGAPDSCHAVQPPSIDVTFK
jgi:hypothetical protein